MSDLTPDQNFYAPVEKVAGRDVVGTQTNIYGASGSLPPHDLGWQEKHYLVGGLVIPKWVAFVEGAAIVFFVWEIVIQYVSFMVGWLFHDFFNLAAHPAPSPLLTVLSTMLRGAIIFVPPLAVFLLLVGALQLTWTGFSILVPGPYVFVLDAERRLFCGKLRARDYICPVCEGVLRFRGGTQAIRGPFLQCSQNIYHSWQVNVRSLRES